MLVIVMNNTTTKYPKFRLLLADAERSPRAIARILCDQAANRLCGLSLDDLPDTSALCDEVDEMESTIANWGSARNPSDEQIKSVRSWAEDAVRNLLADEGFEAE